MAVPRALPLNELLDEFRAGRIALPAVLEAIKSRGVLDETGYRADVALLEQLRESGELDADVVLSLIARLGAMRIIAARAPVDADATIVTPASTQPVTPIHRAVDPELTLVQPTARPAPDDEMTVVNPRMSSAPADQAPSGDTSTRGTTSSLSSVGSWESIASKEGGDYVTVGSLLKGRFHLERELGRGGMGVVYLARDERKVEARDRDPYVAVKVLNDEFRRHPDSLIALQRESRRSQLLAHDNIVRVFDFDKDRTIVFMTMEYIDGSDLKSLIRERAYNGMPLAKARPLIEGMARALARAHAAGIVHSDFKPGNVMVTREGVPKVFDFGIARAGKFAGDVSGEQTVFDAGTLGALTPAYASLEMIRGNEPSPSDDIYALGCVSFELLTGKHPFDKASAEVVQKEERKPPAVPGLTRRQYKTLCDSIALDGGHRLKSAEALIEGLREVSLKERLGPYVLRGSIALVLLVGGGWGLSRAMHSHHLAKVIGSFTASGKQRYTNEVQAMQALASLDEDDRKRVIIDQGEAIQSYLLSRIDAYWNPSRQRFDYAGAQRVLALRDQLRLYSPALDMKRIELDRERNELLNTLDTQLSRQIEAGAIFENQPDNVVDTLTRIRAVDPGSALLKNPELELKYDTAIGQSLASDRLDEAKQHLALADRLFPGSARLQQRDAQLAAYEQAANLRQVAAAEAAQGQQSLPDARRDLAALVAKPAENTDWQAAVTRAATPLQNDNAPETRRLFDALGDAVAAESAKVSDPVQAQRTLAWVNFGLQYAPRSPKLLAERSRLDGLQQQMDAQLAKDSVAAEIDSRIESMRRAAAANDVTKAQESLDRIRALQANHPFLSGDGPQLLATAYLGQAKEAFQHGRYQSAADITGQGMRSLGNRADLRSARERYAFVAELMQGGNAPFPEADYGRLRGQLADLRKTDNAALETLEADLKQRGQLPQGTLAARLESRKPIATSTAAPATTSTAASVATPGADAAVSSAAAKKSAATVAAAAAANAAPATAGKSNAPSGPDPCGVPELVGAGKACFDQFDGKRGPSMVVVPGIGAGHAYALSRAEITINEFNRFCAASGQCHAITLDDAELGSLPVSNISLSQAKAYVAWLSSGSGFTYRLPTDAEWLHAAQAGNGWKQSDDSNCIPPTANGADVTGAAVAARGREPNPWGLINMSGNVWEWVTSDGATLVRGGSFNSYWSDCTVEARRTDSGAPQKDVGFRVLRELK